MDVTPLIRPGQQVIQSYAGGRFRISGNLYPHHVIVFTDQTCAWDAPDDADALEVHHFDPFLPRLDSLDIILLGTGKAIKFPPAALKKALKERGIVLDVMDTGAACRTYNVLMAEGRRIACALITS